MAGSAAANVWRWMAAQTAAQCVTTVYNILTGRLTRRRLARNWRVRRVRRGTQGRCTLAFTTYHYLVL